MAILVTGGAGYIGSHTCVELLKEGYEVVVVDNLYNSSEEALNRVKQITGKEVKFYNVDVLDREALDQVFKKESIDSVIHLRHSRPWASPWRSRWSITRIISPAR